MNVNVNKTEKLIKNYRIINLLKNNSLLIFLILLIIFGSFASNVFLKLENIVSLLRQLSMLGILSCGLTFCMIAGNIDLSLGAQVSLACIISIILQPVNWLFAVAVGLIVGILIGFLNGLIVGRLHTNSIIVTLGMTAVIQSISFQISRGGSILVGDLKSPFIFIGKGSLLKIPVPIIILVIIIIFSYLLLSKTRLGKYVYSVGVNEQISWVFGIKTYNVRLMTFIIMGIFSALAGIILAARMNGARVYVGDFYLFDALTAVILGGTSLSGGKGSIGKTIIGVLIVGIIGNVFLLLGMEYYFQQFAKGLILIAAILINIFFGGGGLSTVEKE